MDETRIPQEGAPVPDATTVVPSAEAAVAPQGEVVSDPVGEVPPSRGRGRRVVLLVVILMIAGLAGGFGYTALAGRLAARADLEHALDLLKESDGVVLQVDDVVRAEITEELAVQAEETLAQLPAARTDIEEALFVIGAAYEDLGAGDREIADALREAADARIAMLEEAPVILNANIAASRALGPAATGIDAMLEAENLSSQGAEKFNLQTKEGVTASTELSNQALEKLEEARLAFEQAMEALPEADMTPFLEYLAAKKELVEQSKTIDELWLADKIADANELVNEYNDQDAEVAALGEELPESETVPIAEAYEELTTEATERYFAARGEAARADTRLRQLLGTEPTDDGATTETSGTPSEDATGAAAGKPGTSANDD